MVGDSPQGVPFAHHDLLQRLGAEEGKWTKREKNGKEGPAHTLERQEERPSHQAPGGAAGAPPATASPDMVLTKPLLIQK